MRISADFIQYKKLPRFTEAAFEPTIFDGDRKLGRIMDELKTETNDGQTFALKSDSSLSVYGYRGIAQLKEFKFWKDGLNQVQPDMKSMITYDLIMSFPNENHDNQSCTHSYDLAEFYWRKGKENRWVPDN